jgi:hypothetical protein
MRKYNLLFFSALLFLFACKWSNTPSGILKTDQMINVMTAMHIVDGSISNIPAPNPDSLYKYGRGRYIALFKRFNTDSTQFKNSFKYYTQHPDIMDDMYTQIMKNLQAKIDSINKPAPIPPPKNALPKK